MIERVTIQHIANSVQIRFGSVQPISSDVLHLSKLSARLVHRMLTPDQKMSAEYFQRVLLHFQHSPEFFLKGIVIQDKTWVHHFDPESKVQS